MVATRSSQGSEESPNTGDKRSADSGSSPAPKKGKKSQMSIEDSIGAGKEHEKKGDLDDEDVDMDGIEDDQDIAEQIEGRGGGNDKNGNTLSVNETNEKEKGEKKNGAKKDMSDQENGKKKGQKNAFDEVKGDVEEVYAAAQKEQDYKTKKISKDNKSVVEDEKREAKMPSSIMEKGIIYFFFRSRINTVEPQGIEDVARSYIVLRPLPIGAKIGKGPLQDDGNARLIALPKKMLPRSKRDRFLTFVEKPKAYIKDLRAQFSGSEYATKTAGTSHQQAATPFAEGVYALTSTQRESHLAYSITYPEIGKIQNELGLNDRGSYVLSVKNPKSPGPANATIDSPAEYPERIQKKFRDLRWSPLEPEMLDYKGTQVLIIGEGLGEVAKAVETQKKDREDAEKESPEEELEKLEGEDHDRVEGLKAGDPVFADLGMSSKSFSKVQTTW